MKLEKKLNLKTNNVKKLKPTYTERTLFYYQLEHSCNEEFKNKDNNLIRSFEKIEEIVTKKKADRFVILNGTRLFLNKLSFDSKKEFIFGRLYKVRDDVFPEIYDFKAENSEDFIIDKNKGLVEATHFVINFKSKDIVNLIVEYNHYGARTTDLIWYLHEMTKKTKIIESINLRPIIKDNLKQIKTSINGIRDLKVRVHKDNINRINKDDEGLASAVHHAQNYSDSEIVEVKFSFDYKLESTEKAKNRILNWVSKFIESPEKKENFSSFEFNAQNIKNNDKIEAFNLLLDKEKSVIRAEKKENSRTLISDLFFEKIIDEYERKFNQ